MSERDQIAFREAVKRAVAEVDAPALEALFREREARLEPAAEGGARSRWVEMSQKAWPVPQAIDQWGLQSPPYARWPQERKEKAARVLIELERAVPGFLWVDRAQMEQPGLSAASCAMEALIRAGALPSDVRGALGEGALSKSAPWELALRRELFDAEPIERRVARLAIRVTGKHAKRAFLGPPPHSAYAWLDWALERGVSAASTSSEPEGLLLTALAERAEPAMIERLIRKGASPMSPMDQSLEMALTNLDAEGVGAIASAELSLRAESIATDPAYRLACVNKLVRLWSWPDPGSMMGGRGRWDEKRYLKMVALSARASQLCDQAAEAGVFCEKALEAALARLPSEGKKRVLAALVKAEARALSACASMPSTAPSLPKRSL